MQFLLLGSGDMAEAQDYNNLKESESFLRWFWSSGNGNDLIKFLNTHEHPRHNDKLRREMFSPYVYGFVFKGTIYDGADRDFERKFKMIKIGFTQCTLKQIKKRFKDDRDENIALIFFVVKSAIDTTRHHDFEERIRKKVGVPVKKQYARSLGLKEPTEWVLTTQNYIDELKMYINQKKEQEGSVDASILKSCYFKNFELTREDQNTYESIIQEICNRSSPLQILFENRAAL